jgi:eukaryotic-like serine/threonine-protein kinase
VTQRATRRDGAPSGAQATGTLRTAQILAGKYVVEHALGKGGMGLVVAARHLQLGTRVAVKVLRSQVRDDPEQVSRLLREARSAGSIHSEHVVQILDVGALDSGSPFVVMEYLEGEDLEARFRRIGPLPVDEAVDYVLQACAAVAAAHAIGVIHRDIKPANLFLTTGAGGRPLLKILDFGISKATSTERDEQKLTATGASLGSPVYMSPEQVKGEEADARTDVWGLGTALYELLSAHTPFEANKVGPLYAKILGSPPVPLNVWRRDLPAGLEPVILRCLEKEMGRRFAGAAELAAALAPFATRPVGPSVSALLRLAPPRPPQQSAPPQPSAPQPISEELTFEDSTVVMPHARPQRPRPAIPDQRTVVIPHSFAVTKRERKPPAALLAIVVACVLGALSLTLFLVLRRSPPPEPASSAPPASAAVPEPTAAPSALGATAEPAPEATAAPTASASAPARPTGHRPALPINHTR